MVAKVAILNPDFHHKEAIHQTIHQVVIHKEDIHLNQAAMQVQILLLI